MNYSKPTLYLCDGEALGCRRTNCYKNGGPCRHTTDVSAALHPDGTGRFVPVMPDGDRLMEVDEET